MLLALPDPNAAFDNLQPLLVVDPGATVVATDPSWDIMSTWKYSIGADYLADLSGIRLGDDWLFSADLLLSEVKNGYDVFEARRSVLPGAAGVAPDGRPIYTTSFGTDDYITRNTSRGSGTVFTLSAAKTFDTNLGMFDMTLGYTNTDVDELRSYNRFIAFESLAFDPGTDLNNPDVAPSRYEVEHRWTGTLTWQKELFGENTSTIGLLWTGRSGRHFSYVYGSQNIETFGGSLFADFGSETETPGTQLFYVPTGTSDPIITGDPAFLADLDEFISSTDCLNAFRGSAVTRNNCKTSWVNVVSLRLMQEITFARNFSFDLMLDIENFGNLLNSDWGRVDSYTAPSNVAPANVEIVGGQYLLTPFASYDPAVGASTIVPRPAIAALPSVYRIQFGIRFRF